MTTHPQIDAILALPVEDRLAAIERIWDSLASNPDSVPVPDWHRQLLDERLAADEADDSPGVDWSELKSLLQRKT